MKYLFFIFCLISPVLGFGKDVKEITMDKIEREKYENDLKFGTPDKRWEAAEILGESGDCKAVNALIIALKDEVPKVRMYVAEALGKLGDKKAKAPLKEVLSDPYPVVRYATGEALARLRDPAGVPIIVQAIRDPEVDYRRRARIAEALSILNDRGTISSLVSVIDDKDSPKVRKEVATALGVMYAQEAVKPLARRLDHRVEEMPSCRVACASALASIGDKKGGIPPLARTLNDPDVAVREAASEALKILVGTDRGVIPILIELLEPDETREYAEITLDSFFNQQNDIPLLSKVVGSTNRPARLYAIRKLEKIKNPGGIFSLIEALEDPDTIIRARSATALGNLGFREPVPALIEFIDDSSIMVAKCVVTSLGKLGDARADTAFLRIMRDEKRDWKVRVITANAIGKLPESAVLKPLLKYLRDSNWRVRYLSAVGLGELKAKRSLNALEYTASHEEHPEVRDAARISVGKLTEKAPNRTY